MDNPILAMKISVAMVSAVSVLDYFLVLVYYLDDESWIMNRGINDQ